MSLRLVSKLLFLSLILTFIQSSLAQSSNRLAGLSEITDAELANPVDEDWLIWRGTYGAHGL